MTKVSKPLISVIVPIWNVEKYLDKCVESIINQSYTNLEIILVDDESPDNCPKMCDEWAKKDSRIKVIHKKNGGVSSARNDGIDKSNGEYVSFVDSDDYIEKDYIKDMYNKLIETNSKYICCGFNKIYHNGREMINSDGRVIEFSQNEYIKALLNVQNGYGFVHMKLIAKEVIGNVRFATDLVVGEDALFNVKICSNIEKAIVYNKALYNYRISLNSAVRKYDDNYVNKYTDSMMKMKNYIEKKYSFNQEIITNIYNYIAYHLLLICVNYCYHPQNAQKYKSLKKVCNMDIYKEATKKSNYNKLSITRKVALFSIKHKLFFLTSIICRIRQSRIRKV